MTPAKLTLLLLITLTTTGCLKTNVIGLVPINPPLQPSSRIHTVQSIQPTFSWKPSTEPNTQYDLIIYQVIKPKNLYGPRLLHRGKRVYYRQGLDTTSHQIQEPLKFNRNYFWSVRVRRSDKTYDWSTYNWKDPWLGTGGLLQNDWFIFRTPPDKQ